MRRSTFEVTQSYIDAADAGHIQNLIKRGYTLEEIRKTEERRSKIFNAIGHVLLAIGFASVTLGVGGFAYMVIVDPIISTVQSHTNRGN